MKKFFILSAVLPALFLAGCGEGWETKLYDGFPYGNFRTAGHGIEYVRAHMMPTKGPVIKTVQQQREEEIITAKPLVAEEPEPVITQPQPVEIEETGTIDRLINSGEKFFRNMQRK